MIFLTALLWPVIASSFLLGAGVGLLTGLPRTHTARWTAFGLVVVTGLLSSVAALSLVPGRAGFWIEGGAVMLCAYLIGAGLAAVSARRVIDQP